MSARLHFATREGSATERTVFHGVIGKLRAGVLFDGRAAGTTGDFYPKCSVTACSVVPAYRTPARYSPPQTLSNAIASTIREDMGWDTVGLLLGSHISERYQKPLHHMRLVTMDVYASGCPLVMQRAGGCRADCPRQLSSGRLASPTGPFGRRCKILQEPVWHKRTNRVAYMAALGLALF